MEKFISLFIAIVLFGASGAIGSMCPEQLQYPVQIGCIVFGGIAIVIFMRELEKIYKEFFENIKITEKTVFDKMDKLLGQYEKNLVEISSKINYVNTYLENATNLEENIVKILGEQEKQYSKNFNNLEEIGVTINNLLLDIKNEQEKIGVEINKLPGQYSNEITQIIQEETEFKQAMLGKTESINKDLKLTNELVEKIKEVPQEMIKLQKELIIELEDKCEDIQEKIKELTDNIAEENSGLNNNIKRNISNLLDDISSNNDDMIQQIEELSNQYKEFEKNNEAIVEKLSLMSKQDYEVLKGYFMDDGNR